jgi:hypothetical protein
VYSPDDPQQGMEKRILLATVLCLLVLFLYRLFLTPGLPENRGNPPPAVQQDNGAQPPEKGRAGEANPAQEDGPGPQKAETAGDAAPAKNGEMVKGPDSPEKEKRDVSPEVAGDAPPEFPEKYKKAVVRVMDLCSVKKQILNPPAFFIRVDAG